MPLRFAHAAAEPVSREGENRHFDSDWEEAAPGRRRCDQRLFLIGMFISSGLISCTSSGTPHAKAGSALILK
jgi:hypothetical protein